MYRIHFFVYFLCALVVLCGSSAHSCQFEQGLKAFHDQENDKAIQFFQHCITSERDIAQSHFYLGIAYRNLGELLLSSQNLQASVDADPDNINYYMEYAYSFEKRALFEPALKIYQQALLLDASHLGARLGQARLLHWLGHVKSSIHHYQQLMQEHKDDQAVKLGLAFALMSDRRLDVSRALFISVNENNPSNVSAQQGLDLLKKIHNYSLKLNIESIDFDGNTTQAQKLSLQAQSSFKTKWGIRFTHYQQAINPFSEEGVISNRSIINEFSSHIGYKLDANREIITELSLQELTQNRRLYQLKLEHYQNIAKNKQLSLSVAHSMIGSKSVNTLGSVGLSVRAKKDLELIGRFFYSADQEFDNSRSISVSALKSFANGSFVHAGGSYNHIGSRKSVSAFFSTHITLTKKMSLLTQLTHNAKDKYLQASVGIAYKF